TDDIEQLLLEEYPLEYWYSYASALEPVVFAKFVTEHFREAETITRRVTAADFAKATRTMICYPVKKFPRLGQIKLQEMLAAAGFWP
ncbi:MAG: hypothetical protein ACE5IO_03590, partial [Thermoplasmata archaeon]